MIDYPPHRRGIIEGQEDYDDQVSNPTNTEIAAYERWMVEHIRSPLMVSDSHI